jgi:anti-sigma factor RsiW
MNITRDIAKDLLPLYVAGEASADTRAAIEAFLKMDPEVARYAASLREDAPVAPALITAPREPARATLARTQALLRRRTWLMASALFCSGLPFSFMADDEGMRFLMVRDAPVASAVLAGAAIVLWVLYWLTARRLKVTGL